MNDIEEMINVSKLKKWQVLKGVETEINKMIEAKIPLTKQVELILKNGILEKLDLSEYRKILIKHFDYESREQKKSRPKKNVNKVENIERKKTPSQLLSEDVDLRGFV